MEDFKIVSLNLIPLCNKIIIFLFKFNFSITYIKLKKKKKKLKINKYFYTNAALLGWEVLAINKKMSGIIKIGIFKKKKICLLFK